MSKKEEFPSPLKAAPNVYKLIFENQRVTVFDVLIKPGEKAKMHKHKDHVVYAIEGGTAQLAFPDGKKEKIQPKTGDTIWMDEQTHETTNLGNKNIHLLVIEVKK
jgi:quercetin dioxygenase-like cupin family protein